MQVEALVQTLLAPHILWHYKRTPHKYRIVYITYLKLPPPLQSIHLTFDIGLATEVSTLSLAHFLGKHISLNHHGFLPIISNHFP